MFQTNRFIDVDFNCLEANVNLQTWVVLLDFLGLGAKIHDEDTVPNEASPKIQKDLASKFFLLDSVNSSSFLDYLLFLI